VCGLKPQAIPSHTIHMLHNLIAIAITTTTTTAST
jgi:hypothetical protein